MKLSTTVLGAIAVVKADGHHETLYGSCVRDEKSDRVLPYRLMESSRLPVRVKSVDECTAGCRAMQRHDNENHFGYPYAGVEYLTECWCGDEPAEGFPFTWSYQCNMRCTGDYAGWQNCGGYGAMNVWSVLPQDIDGICVGDAPGDQRVLQGGSLQRLIVDDLTPGECEKICFDEDFRYYGVEYGDSCYCGNDVDRALRVSQPEECSLPCIGDENEICGGDFRMNLYGPTFFDITANKVVFEHAVVHRWFDLTIDLKLNENFLFDKANIFGVTVAGEPYENAGSQIPALFLEPESMNLEVCMAINGANECGTLADPITPDEWTSLAFEQWCWYDLSFDWCSFVVFKLEKYEDGTEEWIEQWWWWNEATTYENVEGIIGNTYGYTENLAIPSGEYKNFQFNQYETRSQSFAIDISAAPDQSLSLNAPSA